MSKNKLLLVSIREYLRTIRKPTFWIATIFFPVFIVGISFISGFSAEYTSKKVAEEALKVDKILIFDDSGYISENLIQKPYELISDEVSAIQEVKDGSASALFVYPTKILETKSIQIYTHDEGVMSYGKYTTVAEALLKQSILQQINDPEEIALYNSPISAQTTYYKNGETVSFRLEDYIIPIISLLLYFIMVFMGTNFLLTSVSEEKENRMMEIVLTTVTSRELIWGKIIGLVGIVFSQIAVLLVLTVVGLQFTMNKLPITINFADIPLNPAMIGLDLFYILAGFLIIATIMVGVGSAMPTYREAQQFSSIFIIAAIFPVYFASILIADPEGLIARITSYFPLTSPLIFLVRNALGGLPYWEAIASIPLLIVFVLGGFWLAFKLFEFGSTEYHEKITLSSLFRKRDR